MPYQQVKDVLKNIESVHAAVRLACEQLAIREENAQGELLLQNLQRHEREFSDAVKQYECDTDQEGVLNTWLQFPSEEVMRNAFRDLQLRSDLSVENIMQQLLEFNERMITLYQDLAEYTSAEHVTALFADLRQLEEANQRHLARLAQEWEFRV